VSRGYLLGDFAERFASVAIGVRRSDRQVNPYDESDQTATKRAAERTKRTGADQRAADKPKAKGDVI
jgi:hypothetical protein